MAFCSYRPAKTLEQPTSSSVTVMGGDSVSDQSWSMMNFHPVSYGLSTTGMIAALMLVLALSWCCVKFGGKKLFKKLRAPLDRPDVIPNQEPVQYAATRTPWANPTFAPQGLATFNTPLSTMLLWPPAYHPWPPPTHPHPLCMTRSRG